MSVRLISFQYLPRGLDGWGSGLLLFGDLFTAVQGANGTGKTPIMKGIMQALGHEVELPPDVLRRCESAQVNLTVEGRPITLTRRLGDNFDIELVDGGEKRSFHSQSAYAKWFVSLFSSEPRTLTNKQNQESELYANVLFPALWVDQDYGWTSDYWTPSNRNFIQDQREEVIRFLVGMPPRHPFRSRVEFDEAKDSLQRIERLIDLQRFALDKLRSSDLNVSEEPRLLERREELRRELTANGEAIEAFRSSTSVFDREIGAIEMQRDELRNHQSALLKRKGQLTLVLSELDGEEEILTANVQATDLLRQFCGLEGCQMFATSERSFGRSLLFLKDQIKDLQASNRDLSQQSQAIGEKLKALDESLNAKRNERAKTIKASPQAEVSAKLELLTKELVDIELKIARLQQYSAESQRFEKLLNEREQKIAAVAAARLKGTKGASSGDARRMLSDAMQEWLMTLKTKNTKTAFFDDDFVLYVDGSKFAPTTHQSGSTRTRIVLAFHAALLEVSLALGGNHPGWLLFDAPKQHELDQKDFDSYTDRLQLVAGKYPGRVQVVFSVADLKTQFQPGDEVWEPPFTIEGEHRFLGSLGK